MSPAPELSVLVPVYNGRSQLPPTIDSLLAQSFRDFEMVFVDDGSRDGSADYLRSIGDARIRVVQQENRGLAHALNRGIEECRGRYVARNDQDDLSLPHRLERQLSYLRAHPEVACVFSFYTKFGARHSWANTDKHVIDPDAAANAKRFTPLDGCQLASTLMAERSALQAVGGFRQDYYPADDWDLELRLSERFEVRILQEPLVRYHFHTGANTYKYFTVMQDKARWADDSHQRRLAGQPERSFEGFLADSRRGETAAARLTRARLDRSKLYLRQAGQFYLDGRLARAGFSTLLGLCLDPRNLMWRAQRMLAARRRGRTQT